MSELSQFVVAAPNVVLRGGPLEGEQRHIDSRAPISTEVGDERVVYRPSIELDCRRRLKSGPVAALES